jgi:vitamin B12 transporter
MAKRKTQDRTRGRFVRRWLLALAWLVLPSGPSRAQAPIGTNPPVQGGVGEAPPPRIVPPALVAGTCRRDLAPSGRVVLLLTLDARGAVVDVVVEASLAPDVDAAVVADARAFTFTPATSDGVPIASRIRFACELSGVPAGDAHPADGVETPRDGGEARAAPETPADATDRGGVVDAAPTPPEEAPGDDEVEFGLRAVALTDAARLAQSAEAVDVVALDTARRESADLGEVLARERGVSVRRSGGLGSHARISLAGLTDDQIRFFVDGVPMELMGFVNGLANIPIDMLDHIEIYRGILPIRFGADALGGAFNLAPRMHARGTHANASLELGSFGTYRLVGAVEHRAAPSGFYTRATGFFDTTDNDYLVDVEVADASGRLTPARVRRFHDGYRAGGGVVELGFIDTPFASRLILRAFATTYDKELQNNLVMSVPYGEAEYGGATYGASLRYEHEMVDGVNLDAVGGYAFTSMDFLDVARLVYDWYGEPIRERARPGEIDTRPYDQSIAQHSGYVRATTEWTIRPGHRLRVALAPTISSRTGEDRTIVEGNRDPLASERRLGTLVTGLEYEATFLDDTLQAVAFLKDYVYAARSIETLPGNVLVNRDRNDHSVGGGAALRYRASRLLSFEIGYERATRLPRPDEVFGNGALIVANLELVPELSHNVNAEVGVRTDSGALGTLTFDVRFSLRLPEELIVLLTNDRFSTYRNVFASTSLNTEVASSWVSPGEYVTLGANFTHNDHRNRSDQGAFSAYEGDRIPYQPWLFANGSARVDLRDLIRDGDALTFGYYVRYVHWFFRGWESVGRRDTKQRVPRQTTQTLSVTYTVPIGPVVLVTNVEVHNLADAETYDYVGLQRPGRAFLAKLGISY